MSRGGYRPRGTAKPPATAIDQHSSVQTPADRWTAAFEKASKDSWRAGFDTAVQSMREFANEFQDDQIKAALCQVADMLEKVKP